MDVQADIKHIPLCVDLDGSLLSTDTLWEGLVKLLLKKPYMVFHVIVWIFAGKATLKANVAKHSGACASDWPIRQEVLDYITKAKQQGRLVYLATGACEKTACDIAQHLGVFDGVFHSDDQTNLTARKKRDRLVLEFGDSGFDYVGNSKDDIVVFESARCGIVVAPDQAARQWQVQTRGDEIATKPTKTTAIFKAIRVHQWLKNTLIFVPMMLDLGNFSLALLGSAILAFFSFSFFASSVYIINDLSDLKSDRAHARKRFRPLASGDISIPVALATWAALLCASFSLAFLLPIEFVGVLLIYCVVTAAYTFVLKRKLLVDVFTLAGLYTLRIIAGAMALDIHLSYWLLAFSIFFFLSLALVKRFVELLEQERTGTDLVAGRGYMGLDTAMIAQGGIASAFASALVLSLYIDSDAVFAHYDNPWMIWGIVPLVLYLQLRIWILAGRGMVHEDPIVFIMRDWRSQITMAFGCVMVLGALI